MLTSKISLIVECTEEYFLKDIDISIVEEYNIKKIFTFFSEYGPATKDAYMLSYLRMWDTEKPNRQLVDRQSVEAPASQNQGHS